MILCELMSDGIKPKRNYDDDGGYDLFLPRDLLVHEQFKIPLAVKVLIPVGWTGRIVPRSSAYEAGVEVNGTIDRYTGELFLTVKNSKNTSLGYKKGSSIAQLLPVWTGAGLTIDMFDHTYDGTLFTALTACNELEVIEKLPDTERGDKGFGSSGNTK